MRTYALSEREQAGHMLAQNSLTSIPELLRKPGVDAQWLLHQAAKHNISDKMIILVNDHNADVNALSERPPSNIRETPLMATAESGSVAAAQWLLQHGADPNILSHSNTHSATALWTAAENGYVRLAKILLDAGADVNIPKTSTGNTPLFMAVQNGHAPMVTLLLQHGADPNKTKVPQGMTNVEPIVMAIGSQQPALVAQLINAGAKIPYTCTGALHQMRQQKTTISSNMKKKVTDKEINALEELVNVNVSLRDDVHYTKARIAERKGKFRKALRMLRAVPLSCAQLTLDVERVIEHIYGVKGSDGQMGAWRNVPVMSTERPVSLQFYAWAQVGRKIYTHGGIDSSQYGKHPVVDDVWELDVDTRVWSLLKTSGKSPGPRAGHTMFAYQNALYLWGGKGSKGVFVMGVINVEDVNDSDLYRLDVDNGSFKWEAVKVKSSQKPQPRHEHAGVLYKGKYYITGGNLGGLIPTDDTWCLDMTTLKWKGLKRGPTKRHCHGMWAGNGKLYVYGGRMIEPDVSNLEFASHTIADFVAFDLETKSWSSVKVTGAQPFDISEFTVLPLFHGKDKDDGEPSSVIVWGGYTELDQSKGRMTEQIMKSKYGDLAREFSLPYRNRLFRFDLNTETWTLLLPTRDLLPKALSFAAEVKSENGQTQLLIGGGYGLVGGTKIQKAEDFPSDLRAHLPDHAVKHGMMKPEASTNIFEVLIADERGMCFTRDNLTGKHWAWDFFDLSGDRIPTIRVELFPCSPTLHTYTDLTFEDFAKPPIDSVRPNDESNVLGIRVKLHGLKGRQDLNGTTARCGYWQKEKERYQIFIPPYEKGGNTSMYIKPSNLLVAKPFSYKDGADIGNLISRCNHSVSFPNVSMSWITSGNAKFKRRPLDYVLGDTTMEGDMMTWMDSYYGPVSPKAQVLLRTIAMNNSSFNTTLSWIFIPACLVKKGPQKDSLMGQNQLKHRQLFIDFYTKLKERDSARVKKFEADIVRKRQDTSTDDLGSWLKLVVTMDGVNPSVRRELIVSPDISMQSLHHQVLCPAIGWSNNYHCYAYRRLHGAIDPQTWKNKASTEKAVTDSIEMLCEECWIGPKTSTALDSMFQPLYIGGALANDKVITLGDLYALDKQDEIKLQYVHDFGDWWSHTISVSKYDGEVPTSASVAHLVSGEGSCPPEDTGGYSNYAQTMSKLTGTMGIKSKDTFEEYDDEVSQTVDPSNERWWKFLNLEVRGKMNMQALKNPLAFDIDHTRANLEIAIRLPKQKGGKESANAIRRDYGTGLTSSDFDDKCAVDSKQNNPLKFCAVCEVTVALKTCSGCNSIAFCSREHQLQYWPKHKKDCRRIQKASV